MNFNTQNLKLSGKEVLKQQQDLLIDPLARDLVEKVQWWDLKGLPKCELGSYPVTIIGEGPQLLLLHGFDSSFLEFRRLVPILKDNYQLIIPDLFGFGFCPRPKDSNYNSEMLLRHLKALISDKSINDSIGVIGASMGGAVALELAKVLPTQIKRLILLAPAGLNAKAIRIPKPLDSLGVWFLSQNYVRKGLCRQAFAYPGKNVGKAEEQIASLHLKVSGWGRSLASFARSGGFTNQTIELPSQPLKVLWGSQDRILGKKELKKCIKLLGNRLEIIEDCGHLPHLEQPNIVAHYLNKLEYK